MSIDLTPLFQALITLLAGLISAYLIPWLKSKTTAQQQSQIEAAVNVAVYAAEKLYGSGKGSDKLAYVEKYLSEHGFNLDTDTLTALVNAEIKGMELGESTITLEEKAE